MEIINDNTNKHIYNKKANHKQVDNKEQSHVFIMILDRLHVNADSIDAIIHCIHPAVFGRNNEESEEWPNNVVVVIDWVDPFVVRIL